VLSEDVAHFGLNSSGKMHVPVQVRGGQSFSKKLMRYVPV